MTKAEKLLTRFLSRPSDFSYSELKTLMGILGYIEEQCSGARVCFKTKDHKIKLHKPHPGNILKHYQIKYIIEKLKEERII
ncbi:MAG: type II toxin-antitoxin system HicA family toxin [Prolixibacteraceae bacterium]|nr:type II toxin-antitoxin system HicA family toxin [Prolixibacteraceae bacterium]